MSMILIQRQIAGLSITIEGDASRFMEQLEEEIASYPTFQNFIPGDASKNS